MHFRLDVPLPFRLPIEVGLGIVSYYNFCDFKVTFVRQQVNITRAGFPDETADWSTLQIQMHPKGKMLNQINNQTANARLYTVFVAALEYVNRLLDGIRATVKGTQYVRNVTVADLPLAIVIHQDNDGYVYVTRYLTDERELGSEVVHSVGITLDRWDVYPEIMTQERFLASARTSLLSERFTDAVIELQTSFEVFIRNIFRYILRTLGTTDAEIARQSGAPFRNVIEQHLANQLKAVLNFGTPGPIKDWHDNLYLIRNEVVHQGRVFVSRAEADQAYASYVMARNHISDLLFAGGFTQEKGQIDLDVFRPRVPDPKMVREIRDHLVSIGFISATQEPPDDPKSGSNIT